MPTSRHIAQHTFPRLGAMLLCLLLAFPAAAQLAITNSGKIKLLRADGSVVSQHNQVKEAYERATVDCAAGTARTCTYRITLPDQTLVYTLPAAPAPPPVEPPPVEPPPSNPPPASGAFNLPPLAADPIVGTVAKPARGKSFVDPVYGVTITRATQASDGTGDSMQVEYSRRQAFNKDNTRYLAQASNGYWFLYDAKTFAPIRKLGGMAGDCEPLWSASNPRTLIYTSTNGGTIWWTKDVETDTDTVLINFAGKTPWSNATHFWTKGEGSASKDGRYLALMAETDGWQTVGLLVLDTVNKTVVSTLDASKFGGNRPDHVSMSPSGNYVVPSWAFLPAYGTRAYTRDFSSFRQLFKQSEHSDLAVGPNGEDFYVYFDYDDGMIRAQNIASGAEFDIMGLYLAPGESWTGHISGQAFDRPGWVVISADGDSANYGAKDPAPTLRPPYRKVWIAELKPNGRQYSLAHERNTASGYFGEVKATASRDLSRVAFNSNLGSGVADSYIVTVPFR